jgi:hypothetical protein
MKTFMAFSIIFLSCHVTAQTSPSAQSADLIEKIVVAALSFQQDDLRSLQKAQSNFTAEGWAEFLKKMQGFLETNGAPTFTSTFVPAAHATITKYDAGIANAKVPGTLTQTHYGSKAVYRLRIEVQTVGTPPKISHLEQITCLGAAAAKYCM